MSTQSIDLDRLTPHVHRVMEQWKVPGLAVALLHAEATDARGFGVTSLETRQPITPQTLFPIGSISKIFTATLIMQLIDEGILDLDVPVCSFLPDLTLADANAQRQLTLRHLLTHTSGLEGNLVGKYGYNDDALIKAITAFDALRQITSPGELWSYCNSGFSLAAAVVERVAGMTFERVMRERLFEPLEMARAFYFAREAIAYPVAVGHVQAWQPGAEIAGPEIVREYEWPRFMNAAGGIISTVEDVLCFAALHLGDGMVHEKRLLTQQSIQAMQTPQVRAIISFADSYGVGWALRTVDGVKLVGHTGSGYGFEARLTLVPQHQFALMMLSNSTGGDFALRDIERRALEEFCGLQLRDPLPHPLSPQALRCFAGHYQEPESDVKVMVHSTGLRVDLVRLKNESGQEVRYPPMLLQPIGEQEFIFTEGEYIGSRVDFILGAAGKPRFMRVGGRLMAWVPEAGDY